MSILKSIFIASAMSVSLLAAPSAFANQSVEEIADIKTNADITIGLNGLVCDFCSIALNKTFRKNGAVAATYVDIDAKSMFVVLKDGTALSDAELTELVKNAGYNVADITRKAD